MKDADGTILTTRTLIKPKDSKGSPATEVKFEDNNDDTENGDE